MQKKTQIYFNFIEKRIDSQEKTRRRRSKAKITITLKQIKTNEHMK